jgi:phosphatidylserine/phosphatidylglycerophosphate/cardiolipin synthase-like enzyme
MIIKQIFCYIILAISISLNCCAADLDYYHICFIPTNSCLNEIVSEIDQAKQRIYIQASNLTSDAICRALAIAKKRGVDVLVILDKSQWRIFKTSAAPFLLSKGMSVWIDYRTEHLNNNIMIIDNKKVILGGIQYNDNDFKYNADNVLMINNGKVVNDYINNWNQRMKISKPIALQFHELINDKSSTPSFNLISVVKSFIKM